MRFFSLPQTQRYTACSILESMTLHTLQCAMLECKTLQYTTLHGMLCPDSTTLHYNALCWRARQCATQHSIVCSVWTTRHCMHYNALCWSARHCNTQHSTVCSVWTARHCTTLLYAGAQDTALHSTSLYALAWTARHCTTLLYAGVHYTALHTTPLYAILESTTLYYTALCCSALHCIMPACKTLYYTALCWNARHCTTLLYAEVQDTALHSTPLYALSWRAQCITLLYAGVQDTAYTALC